MPQAKTSSLLVTLRTKKNPCTASCSISIPSCQQANHFLIGSVTKDTTQYIKGPLFPTFPVGF